ncbi:MAG: FemAB family XrtA/PEP-CTERM system-associated protein [Gemmataceae bacterium]
MGIPIQVIPPRASAHLTQVRLYGPDEVDALFPRLDCYLLGDGPLLELSRHPAWLRVLARGLGHVPYCLEATDGGRTTGFLALSYVESLLFGRYLASMPYLNYGGVQADDDETAGQLIDRAVELADRLKVRRLELRHEHPVAHPKLGHSRTDKVHMRLDLPGDVGQLEKGLDPKVRNQVKKGRKHNLEVVWGGRELLDEFYGVFARNMRDLGTPVYSRRLFASALEMFPDRAELCIVRGEGQPLAGALLLHGWGVTEVPSASSLRSHNNTCANMLMYFHLLARAVERGQDVFDFGRATPGGGTFRFKEQWGAQPSGSAWQSYLRAGSLEETRPDNPRYQWRIRMWQRLPLWVAGSLGPWIVRGIP